MTILSLIVGSFVYFTITTLTEHFEFSLLTKRKRVKDPWHDDNAQIPFATAHHFVMSTMVFFVFPDVFFTMVF